MQNWLQLKYISRIIYEFLQIHFFLVPLRFLDTSGLPFQRKLTRAEENRLKSFSSTYSLSSSHIFRVSSDYGRKYRFRSRFGRLHYSPLCNGRLCHCVMPQYAWYCSTWGYSCRGSYFLISCFSRMQSWRLVMLFIFSELRLSNGWVATAPYQLSFKNIVLISLCFLVLISEGFSVCRVDMADTIKMVG